MDNLECSFKNLYARFKPKDRIFNTFVREGAIEQYRKEIEKRVTQYKETGKSLRML